MAAVEAEAYANLGQERSCAAALASADEAMARSRPGEDPSWVGFFDRARLAGYKGACYLRLGQAEPAQSALREALRLLEPSLVKYRCINLADLATALVKHLILLAKSC